MTQFIAAIGELYAIEAKAKDLSAEQRGQQRHQLSKPVLAKIEGLLQQHLHAVTPGSLLGKALHYLSSQWSKLMRFVDHGAWPIDNNLCENAIRPFAMGRRNWLFCDTVTGAKATANLNSLIETCKANRIDHYSTDAFYPNELNINKKAGLNRPSSRDSSLVSSKAKSLSKANVSDYG